VGGSAGYVLTTLGMFCCTLDDSVWNMDYFMSDQKYSA